MNNLIKTTAIAALLSTAVFAQSAEAQQKIGIVNFQAVFQNLPQARDIETKLQSEFKERIEEIQGIEKRMSELREKQQRDASIMSPSERLELEREYEMLESTRQLKIRALREDTNRRTSEERDKLMMDIARATQTVAGENDFDLVIQSSAVAHAVESADLTDEVLAKMTGGN